MPTSSEQMRSYSGPVLFSFGFRPFFLAAAITAALVPLATGLAFSGLLAMDPPGGLVDWHGHEMVYGYLGAVVAGFILTAIPNWTGRLPLLGWPLMGLVGLWLMGRLAMMFAGGFAAGLVDGAFLLALDLIVWREVIAGRNWRNAPVALLVLLLAIGNLIWHADIAQGRSGGFGLHFGIGVILILLALIGGRVTLSFTRNWLAKTGRTPIHAPFSAMDRAALTILAMAIAMWFFRPHREATGVLFLLAGLAHFMRLARWRGWRTQAEPLVLILHIGYFWLAAGLALTGLAIIAPAHLPAAAALHALTAGAMGVMPLAVMTRAIRGHTGRPLQADATTVIIFLLANLGALLRVAAPLAPYESVLLLSGVVWSAAFALFAIIYGRYLLTPRVAAQA